jgi:leucyl-tRNA synthetase
MQGYNVLFPIGFDAFGLPTENYAIKNHMHPRRRDHKEHANSPAAQMLGYSFDWDREINTTDPGYYKWTQWIFLQMFKHDLAYKASMPVNWCTSCKCVLANEEVVEGVCERCGSPVIRKEKSQWMLGITKYARASDRRSGRCGLHRARKDPAAQLDRQVRRHRGGFHRHQRRQADGFHHPLRHAVRRDLHGACPRSTSI